MANFKKVKLQNLFIYELSTIVAGQTVNKNKQQQNRGENRRNPHKQIISMLQSLSETCNYKEQLKTILKVINTDSNGDNHTPYVP